MRKPFQEYDLEISDDDYEMKDVMTRDKKNFESQDIWFYVGADSTNPRFAKIGITMGNMASRSYCSANPNYYLFCAFQCRYDTTKQTLKSIEEGALAHLDDVFPNCRARHKESNRLSECYYNIDFESFFLEVHEYLYSNHYTHFQATGFEDEYGIDQGHALAWEFNPCLSRETQRRFRNLILRW